MSIEIGPFTEDHVDEVRAFNRRLSGGGVPFQFPESPVPAWLPRRDAVPLYQEFFVVREGDAVRGAYVLKPQAFSLRGETRIVNNLQLPLSEGVIDPQYGLVGVRLVNDALTRQPLTFCLGMGGLGRPLPRLLKAMKWALVECPFYFRVARPYRFLRESPYLRRGRARRLAMDALAFSGLGWVGLKAVHAWKGSRPGGGRAGLGSEVVGAFSGWADALWERAKGGYGFAAVRDAAVLNALYPAHDPRFLRLRVARLGEPVGWAVLLDTPMTAHKHFGRMRVGTVVDCLAVPGAEADVADAATGHLTRRGVDLIVTNQLHRTWGEAFRRAGYLSGPSNFVFAASPDLAAALDPFAANAGSVHMTRGDGDGPIHL